MELVLIKVKSRANHAQEVQKVLTEFGCCIKLRLGLHEITSDSCANDGLIILQVSSEGDRVGKMIEALREIDELEVKVVTM